MDLTVVAIGIGICSILGLPWVVAATVLSLAHVQSLFVESTCTAPGERPKFLGVRLVFVSLYISKAYQEYKFSLLWCPLLTNQLVERIVVMSKTKMWMMTDCL